MQLTCDTALAGPYGLDVATLVHNIHFWVKINAANHSEMHYHNGKYWTYQTYKGLSEYFDHVWSEQAMVRLVKKCRNYGLIETDNFNDDPRDRTLWYTTTETVNCIYRNRNMVISKKTTEPIEIEKCINEQIVPTDSTNTPIVPKGTDDGFAQFWDAYPKKVAKGDAQKAFAKIKPNDETMQVMLDALAWQRKAPQWKKDNGSYIPNPATWLNGKRWLDEKTSSPPEQVQTSGGYNLL